MFNLSSPRVLSYVKFGRAALFALFTAPLLLSHIHLMMKGQTTVESMNARAQKDREGQALADAFRFWQIRSVRHCFPLSQLVGVIERLSNAVYREKRKTKQMWDEEWGSIDKAGNLWWLGSAKKGWLDVMGNNRWGWFCECISNSLFCFFFLSFFGFLAFGSFSSEFRCFVLYAMPFPTGELVSVIPLSLEDKPSMPFAPFASFLAGPGTYSTWISHLHKHSLAAKQAN